MNRPRKRPTTSEDLRERLNATFVALRRQHEQLEVAFEPWRGADGQQRFTEAYDSDDAGLRNEAELLHANFERCHQLARDILELGGKLAERSGRLPKPDKAADRIDRLRNAGVLTRGDEELLRHHASVRNESQHAYVQAAPASVYEAAEQQLRDGRKLASRLGDWIKALGDA